MAYCAQKPTFIKESELQDTTQAICKASQFEAIQIPLFLEGKGGEVG